MYYKSILFAGFSAALLISSAAAQDDPNKQYGAKELYLRARQLPYRAAPSSEPTPAPKVETPPAKPVPVAKPPAKAKPVATTNSTPAPGPTPAPTPPTKASTLPDGGQIVRASAP